MVPTERPVVAILGGADRVAMVPPKFEATPAATQLAVVTHDTPERDPTPDGGAMEVQDAPPLVVLMMLVPPTAVHVDALMQLTEVKVVEPAGVPRSFHCEPPLLVPIAWDPVARQVVAVEQEMPLRTVPDGAVCGTQVPPPFVVLRIAAPGPPAEEPTAVQCVESAQEIPVKLLTVAGNVSDDHAVPPSVETMMLGEAEPKSLTAWQIEVLDTRDSGQDADSGWDSSGRPSQAAVGGAHGDRTPKDAESDGRAVAGCRTRDPVQSAHLGGNDNSPPRISSIDGGEDRVDSHSEAVGGARTRDRVQVASAGRWILRRPGQSASRCSHDG